jgi:S1-C subfamily serine protease
VRVDNKEVKDVASLGDVLLDKQPGNVVPVQVQCGSQQLTVSVELGELQVE